MHCIEISNQGREGNLFKNDSEINRLREIAHNFGALVRTGMETPMPNNKPLEQTLTQSTNAFATKVLLVQEVVNPQVLSKNAQKL